ncbi:MAG TPA: hypothetical protein VFE46_06525 [Pirellulales bacterium]|jgi:hypothetical protein|nr:hypothetical protein [Pirellulales bacterium]
MISSMPSAVQVNWTLVQRRALVVAGGGIIMCAIGAVFWPDHFFRAYLVAWNFWLGIALGSLVLLMTQYLTGGAWGLLLRRIFEAAAGTLPVVAILFLPLVAGLPQLYVWTQSQAVAESPELLHKAQYLNPVAFEIRAAIYLGLWIVLAVVLRHWSNLQDRLGPSADLSRRCGTLSGPGIVIYGLTITFASVDWVMSLEPRWYSTIYPPLFAAGQLLSGIAFSVAVIMWLAERGALAGALHTQHRRDLGNLVLTFVMLWAYLSFSQFLIIWAENLPEEIPWYLHRIQGGWQWTAMALVLFQFAAPFLLLLSREMKESSQRLAGIALLVLAMRFVDLYWWIEAAYPGGMSFYWVFDLAALAAIGGIWTWCFLWLLKRRPLLPTSDPYLAEYLPEVAA